MSKPSTVSTVFFTLLRARKKEYVNILYKFKNMVDIVDTFFIVFTTAVNYLNTVVMYCLYEKRQKGLG